MSTVSNLDMVIDTMKNIAKVVAKICEDIIAGIKSCINIYLKFTNRTKGRAYFNHYIVRSCNVSKVRLNHQVLLNKPVFVRIRNSC